MLWVHVQSSGSAESLQILEYTSRYPSVTLCPDSNTFNNILYAKLNWPKLTAFPFDECQCHREKTCMHGQLSIVIKIRHPVLQMYDQPWLIEALLGENKLSIREHFFKNSVSSPKSFFFIWRVSCRHLHPGKGNNGGIDNRDDDSESIIHFLFFFACIVYLKLHYSMYPKQLEWPLRGSSNNLF